VSILADSSLSSPFFLVFPLVTRSLRIRLRLPGKEVKWSAYSGTFGRKFLRLDQFLKSTGAKAEENVPDPKLFP
jgi:hypothetical protein